MSVSTAISQPQETDIPKPSTYLPTGWSVGAVYTAAQSVIGANNPMFINGPVPLPAGYNLRDVATVGNYHWQSIGVKIGSNQMIRACFGC